MKGIILAGGNGTRLYPATKVTNKHLLAIYDKPMIFYSFSILMQCNIFEVLLISNPTDLLLYQELLGNGKELGLSIKYKPQNKPRGIAEAFLIGEDFIDNDNVALILGDNFLYNEKLTEILKEPSQLIDGAYILGCRVDNPQAFAVVEINNGNIVSIEEKPTSPKSDLIIPGVYFYDNKVVKIAKNIRPSNRGELEITSVNTEYLSRKLLKLKTLDPETMWWDLGTIDDIFDASIWVEKYQKQTGRLVGCLEELAYRLNYISKEKLKQIAQNNSCSEYNFYLKNLK